MRRIFRWGAVSAGLLALPAYAQWDETKVEEEAESEMDQISLVEDMPMTVSLEGGLGIYTGSLAEVTAAGPLWGVRAGVQQDFYGAELAYQGTRNPIENPVLDAAGISGAVWRHELEALGKLGVPVAYELRPFVGAGLGVAYVNVSDTVDPPYRNDFLAQVPLAAGVDWQRGMLHAGVRASWSFLLFDEFVEPTPAEDNPSGGLFTGSLVVGGQF